MCIRDRDVNTAWALFRTTDATGNRVRVDGNSLLVAGVLDVERPLLMVSAAQDAGFDRLAAGSREELAVLAAALGEEMDPFEFSGLEISRAALLLCIFPCLLYTSPLIPRLRNLLEKRLLE